jgi:hypothetical protein
MARGLSIWAVCIGTALLGGCQTDREAILIGKWETSDMFGPAMTMRLAPAAQEHGRGSAAVGAANILKNTALEVRKDQTFTLIFAFSQMDGVWSFSKKSGEMVLSIGKVTPLMPQISRETSMQGQNWTARLDPDNTRLRIIPADPKLAPGMQGPLADGIPLKKAGP